MVNCRVVMWRRLAFMVLVMIMMVLLRSNWLPHADTELYTPQPHEYVHIESQQSHTKAHPESRKSHTQPYNPLQSNTEKTGQFKPIKLPIWNKPKLPKILNTIWQNTSTINLTITVSSNRVESPLLPQPLTSTTTLNNSKDLNKPAIIPQELESKSSYPQSPTLQLNKISQTSSQSPMPRIDKSHPTLNARCYTYHRNMTAENMCCRMMSFDNSQNLLHKCINSANEKLSTEGGSDEGRGVHWAIFGDSHMRYLFAVFLTRFNSPQLQCRLKHQTEWTSAKTLERTLRANKLMHQNIEVRDQSIHLRLTFVWDKFLEVFQDNMTYWEKNPQETPSLIIFAGALWWMLDTQDIYAKWGPQAAVTEYEYYLKTLRPQLTQLAKRSTVIFKLLDDLRRANGPSNQAINTRTNYPLYNQAAISALSGTGVLIWDSTVPLSYAYTIACLTRPRTTPPRYLWKCTDQGHVGYILVEQYANMILNLYCNKYFNLNSVYCS